MILAFDPGETTGWAAYSARFDTYRCGELDDDLGNLYAFMTKAKPSKVAYETFRKRAQIDTDRLYSPQVIGVIRLWAQQKYIPTFKFSPSQTKSFWTDVKIKRLGLWVPGQKHAMDAVRVLLTCRQKTDKTWFREILGKISEPE